MTPLHLLAIGGATVDRKYRLAGPAVAGSSNPGEGSTSFGGVAHNVAVNAAALGLSVAFASALGRDDAGRAFRSALAARGVDTAAIIDVEDARTAEYVAVLAPGGDLVIGIADMAVLDRNLDRVIDGALARADAVDWVFADCNMPRATFERFLDARRGRPFRLAVDAVSVAKAKRLPDDLTGVDVLFLNRDEARAVLGRDAAPADLVDALIMRGAGAVMLTLGAEGAVGRERSGPMFAIPSRPVDVVDVTGAGDAFIAGTLTGLAAASRSRLPRYSAGRRPPRPSARSKAYAPTSPPC